VEAVVMGAVRAMAELTVAVAMLAVLAVASAVLVATVVLVVLVVVVVVESYRSQSLYPWPSHRWTRSQLSRRSLAHSLALGSRRMCCPQS
jgi:hypothetical protein